LRRRTERTTRGEEHQVQSTSTDAAIAPAYAFFGTTAIVQAASEQTGGAYSLIEMRSTKGNQPPLHSHDHDDEGFYVIEGEVRVHAGPDTLCLGPGQCAVAPRGVPHTYVVESDQARWLVTSNGGFDRLLRELGEPLPDADTGPTHELQPLPTERILEAFSAHHIQLLGPPGALPS
jgi:mannose-6-phosphate isomerase-like protein (cupin superfamily)